MDLHELATNAETNHWPPHLGVTSDAEKIAYLAEQLRKVDHIADENESLRERIKTAEEEVDYVRAELSEYRDKLEKIREIAA